MKTNKYFISIAILAAFLAGNFMGNSSSDKELEKKYEQERQQDRDAIEYLLHENTLLKARMDTREKDYQKDSAAQASALTRQESITAALKKENERINYKSYSNPDLDSIDAILFGSR